MCACVCIYIYIYAYMCVGMYIHLSHVIPSLGEHLCIKVLNEILLYHDTIIKSLSFYLDGIHRKFILISPDEEDFVQETR